MTQEDIQLVAFNVTIITLVISWGLLALMGG